MSYKWTAGRYVRTIVGLVLFVVNLTLIGLEVWALVSVCKAQPNTVCSVTPWGRL